jgi:serine/threonine-protein kinase PknG
LLERALTAIAKGLQVPQAVLGKGDGNAREREVRFALEGAYREMARAVHGSEKISLVDKANSVRPRTRT